MFKKIDKQMKKRCTDALEFYDINGYFPWQKKKVVFTISRENIKRLDGIKNKSKFIDELISIKLG